MIIYATVRLVVSDTADPQEVIAECDYMFKHKDIIDTEIIDVEEVE